MSSSQTPLVSVVIACHNPREWIEDAIKSVLRQTYPNKEIIVVDDGSDDASKIVLKYPVAYVHLDDRGAAECFNRGIRMSHGDYYIKLDADDALESDYVEKTMSRMLQDERIGFVYTARRVFGEVSVTKPTKPFDRWRLLHHNYVNPSALVRRRAFDSAQGYDPKLPSCEDWDLWITLVFKGWKGKAVFEPLQLYRVHNPSEHLSRGAPRATNIKAFKMIVKKRKMIYATFGAVLLLVRLKDKILHPRRHNRGDVVSRDKYIIHALIGWVFRRQDS